jgi:hypothetical protein
VKIPKNSGISAAADRSAPIAVFAASCAKEQNQVFHGASPYPQTASEIAPKHNTSFMQSDFMQLGDILNKIGAAPLWSSRGKMGWSP